MSESIRLHQYAQVVRFEGSPKMKRFGKEFWSTLTVFLLSFSILTVPNTHASTDGNCEFGYESIEYEGEDYETYYECELMKWEYTQSSDGFDKKTLLYMPEDLADLPGGTTIYKLGMHIRCTSKKLEIYFASNYVLFDKDNRSYSTKLQYRVDSGKVISTTFNESTDNEAFFVNSPKTFAANLVKGKKKLSIKFSTNEGSAVSQFPISDLSKYRSKFSSAGCKF
jgi:hypothetical protein